MSEREETESVGAASLAEHDVTSDQLDTLYQDLPSDATALKAIVGTMRIELTKKDKTVAKLKEEIDEVKASHSVVLQRSAEWQDELESLRVQVPHLEAELKKEKSAREAEADRVKDLRIRAEESRRAIMRLQGEQSDARAKAKADNRRSWIPPASTSPIPPRDEAEEAELKKSKRASLAFGPNSLIINPGIRPGSSGHRRTASGSRSVSGASKGEAEELEDVPLSPGFANGLRGLRLSGTGGMNGLNGATSSLLVPSTVPGGTDNDNSAPNSRRSSFRSDAGTSRSPRISPIDLPSQDATDTNMSSLSSRLAVPPPSAGVPRASTLMSPALSQGAASSAGVGSPIIEDREEEEETSANKALPEPPVPVRSVSIGNSAQDRELKARELEIEKLSRELSEMRLSMHQAIEARQASEACLKALRDFIANHDAEADAQDRLSTDADDAIRRASVGTGLLKGVKLPPLPTDDIDDATEAEARSRAGSSPLRTFGGGWGMKLPNLMRKTTSSSGGAAGTPSNGPTPSDENAGSIASSITAPGNDTATTSSSSNTSPRDSVGVNPSTKTTSSGFAGLGNLLTRAGMSGESPFSPGAMSPSQPLDDAGAAGAFRGFGWFKRASVVNGISPTQAPYEGNSVILEEKVLSPPFRSLDHDQLAISRQSIIGPSPDSEVQLNGMQSPTSSNLPSASSSTRRVSSYMDTNGNGNGSNGMDIAARFGELQDEENAKKVAENIRSNEPELSHRAQKAAEKTSHVQEPDAAVPSFD